MHVLEIPNNKREYQANHEETEDKEITSIII
jgi:hypothetical protein